MKKSNKTCDLVVRMATISFKYRWYSATRSDDVSFRVTKTTHRPFPFVPSRRSFPPAARHVLVLQVEHGFQGVHVDQGLGHFTRVGAVRPQRLHRAV